MNSFDRAWAEWETLSEWKHLRRINYEKTRKAYEKARIAHDKAFEAYEKARKAYEEAREAKHAASGTMVDAWLGLTATPEYKIYKDEAAKVK